MSATIQSLGYHRGPCLNIVDCSSYKVSLYLLAAVLWRGAPDVYRQALQRLAGSQADKVVYVDPEKPWLAFDMDVTARINDARLLLATCNIRPDEASVTALQRNLYTHFTALLACGMMEKLLGAVDNDKAHKLCSNDERVKLILAWVEEAGTASLIDGMNKKFKQQARCLREVEPALWQQYIAGSHSPFGAKPAPLYNQHCQLAVATGIILAHKVSWDRFSQESMGLPNRWQEDATLLGLVIVLLYEVFDRCDLDNWMHDCTAALEVYLQHLEAGAEAQANPEPPAPAPPPRTKPTLVT